METYAHGYGNTGHYARPGTHTSYCGRELMHEPNTPIAARICQSCAKAEQRDRIAAEQVAADHATDGPTLAERAGVRYCEVGTGRRIHYSNNDDTLCGREVTEYTDGLTWPQQLCARCIKAAEKRAYARSLAAASPLAAAAVDLAETIEQAAPPADESATVPGTLVDPWTWIRRPSSSAAAKAAEERAERRQQLAASRGANAYSLAVAAVRKVVRELPQAGALRVRVTEGSPEATLTRDDLHALAYSGHTTADAAARVRAALAAHIRHGEREVHVLFPALGMRPALYLPDVMALLNRWDDQAEADEQFDRAARAVDAVEHAEETGAAVATVQEAEAVYAAALITEAEADAGTWRGEWIGEQPADTLFAVEQDVEQGALFSEAAPAEQPEKLVVRVRFEPAAVERVKAKAAADRAAWRSEMDARKATEAARYGAPEHTPTRRVVEGVIVEHSGTSAGSTPSNATHPNVRAACEALSGLAVARLTERHDVSEPTDEEQAVRGYMVEPRGGRRVAVYWLEGGATIRRDTLLHGAALDCLAHRLNSRGWNTEPLRASSLCVFAWRPA